MAIPLGRAGRWTFLGALALALLAAGAPAAEEASPEKPPPPAPTKLDAKSEDLLKSCAAAYAALKSYSGSAQITMTVARKDAEYAVESRVKLLLERPNRGLIEVESRPITYALLSDGTNFWAFIKDRNQYLREAAPDRLGPLLAGGALKGTVVPLFGDAPYEALLAGAEAGEYVGRETDGPRPFQHVRLRQGITTIDLWIDEKDNLVRRVRALAKNADTGDWSRIDERHFVTDLNAAASKTAFQFRHATAAKVASFAVQSLLGKHAPDTEAMVGGEKVALLSRTAGRPTALTFWAAWCAPCATELAALERLREEYRAKGLTFVAVNVRDGGALVTEYVRKLKLGFEPLQDPFGLAATVYGVSEFPNIVLIDAKGVVRKVLAGVPRDLDEYEKVLRREFNELLGAKATPGGGKAREARP